MSKPISVFIFVVSLVFQLAAQETKDPTSLNREKALKIYIDCDNCDQSYFKENFTIVNYVRDRKVADVHIIISEMETGSGGTEFMVQFIGVKRFEVLSDTVIFSQPADYTDDEERSGLLRHIQLGLVPFILKTPFANKLTLDIDNENKDIEEIDPWKNWVFELYGYGNANGEKSYKYLNLSSGISLQKVTPDIKIEINCRARYNESKFRLYEDDSLVYSNDTYQRSYYSNNLITKSIGQHWGVGGFLHIRNSNYNNLDLEISLKPAIEYNFFKYSEASRKQLRFLYTIGYEYFDYTDTTIYNKLNEQLFVQNLSIMLKYIVKWGSVEAAVYGSNYLHNFSLFHIGTFVGADVRIFKGLSVSLWGGFDMPRDQIALKKGTTSAEDVLTRRHEMETDYNFWVNFGFSYTFGSIYNNVVNPRFDMDF
jgi:hypothetical protein